MDHITASQVMIGNDCSPFDGLRVSHQVLGNPLMKNLQVSRCCRFNDNFPHLLVG